MTDNLKYDGSQWRDSAPPDVFTLNGIKYIYVGKAIEHALPPDGVVFGGAIYVPIPKHDERHNDNSQNNG